MRKQVADILTSRGLVSVMNNTRWIELRKAIATELPWPPAYQLKSLLNDKPDPQQFDLTPPYFGDWSDSLIWQNTLDIEWIRVTHYYSKYRGALIAPEVISIEAELRDLLRRLDTPRIYHEDSTLIFGYLNSTSRLEPNKAHHDRHYGFKEPKKKAAPNSRSN